MLFSSRFDINLTFWMPEFCSLVEVREIIDTLTRDTILIQLPFDLGGQEASTQYVQKYVSPPSFRI